MDGLYIAGYVTENLVRKRIPLVDDVMSFSELYAQHGGGAGLMVVFLLSLVTTLSIGVSAVLWIYRPDYAWRLALAQTPLRLLIVVPSVSFLPWLPHGLNIHSVIIAFSLLIGSELLKVASILLMKRLKA
jgi:hypothetical protein